jgi:hypothetical protein
MTAMPAMTRDLGDSHGLALLEGSSCTFVTTKFSHFAGRMSLNASIDVEE